MTTEPETRAEELAQNQALFREVNERVREVAEAFGDDAPSVDFLCECADPSCAATLSLTPAQYERLRGDADHFAVIPDSRHVVPDVERVVERHDRYWVVEKVGASAAVARELDPRPHGDGVPH
jgi:hypothetical protein